jgi:hypothetical protein
MDRRQFLAAGFAAPAALAAQTAHDAAQASAPIQPFSDPDFGFTAQTALGAGYYRAGDPGKLLAIAAHIKPGDFDSACRAYYEAGVQARKLAEAAAAKRHAVSAREAYLWAAEYFSCALKFLVSSKETEWPSPSWRQYDDCWSAAAALFEPAAERLEIPYEGASLTAWFFRVDRSRRRRPLVILNTGADGLEISMYVHGCAGGLSRGYNCLILNGPGQCDSLWAKKLYFRPDWEKVITPVVDVMLRRREVDPKRIALVGVSQGGYMVPRALAFEHRIAAGVADPGGWNVAEPWLRNLPKPIREMLDAGKQSDFDRIVGMGVAANSRTKAVLQMRMRPYGITSYYEAFRAVQKYSLEEVAGQIRCPMLITDPEGEQFFPGQSQKLYDALRCPKTLVKFTHDQGADQHCEVAAPGYRDYCIYNWLNETL